MATKEMLWRRISFSTLAGPAMLGQIGRGGKMVGVRRTWITATGRARLEDGTKAPEKWLGLTDGMYGHPIRFSPVRPVMIVGEGIESTLAGWSVALRAGADPAAP